MAEQIPSCIEQQRPSFPSASNTILTVGANKRKTAFLPIRSRSLTNECSPFAPLTVVEIVTVKASKKMRATDKPFNIDKIGMIGTFA
jgi:hypothetical protein